MKYLAAHTRAQRFGITADILTRDSQGSAGYWEIVQDSLADLDRPRVADRHGPHRRVARLGAIRLENPCVRECSLWIQNRIHRAFDARMIDNKIE